MKTLLLLILEILPIFNIYKVGFSGLYHSDRRQHSGYFVPWVGNKELVQRCWKVCNEKMTWSMMEVHLVQLKSTMSSNVLCTTEGTYRRLLPHRTCTFFHNNFIFRSKNNPYWNTLVISGYDVNADEPFLGQIDSQVSHLMIHYLWVNRLFRAHHSKQNLSVPVLVDFWSVHWWKDNLKQLVKGFQIELKLKKLCKDRSKYFITETNQLIITGALVSQKRLVEKLLADPRFLAPRAEIDHIWII